MRFWVGVITSTLLLCGVGGHAKSAKSTSGKLVVLADDVTIYSGPSFRFRPLRTVDKGTELAVASTQRDGPDGLFYEVYYQFKKSGRKAVGFISAGAAVDVTKANMAEDVNAYEQVELADSAVWMSFGSLGKDNYLWGLSYVKYLAPGVYFKFLGGQFVNLDSSSSLLGGEVGLDQLVWDKLSIYGGFSWSLVFSSKENVFFTASQAFTPMVLGSFGVRYNLDRYAAVSAGALISTLFNQNNAALSTGFGIALEVGL